MELRLVHGHKTLRLMNETLALRLVHEHMTFWPLSKSSIVTHPPWQFLCQYIHQ